MESISWRDPDGNEWRGGLVYPVGYEPGRRYPLVVQTHGFDEIEFLIDGPYGMTTAYAAQPLASAGMFVLQIDEIPRAVSSDRSEPDRVVAGYKAGIATIIERKLVHRERIGMIAFSRTGMYAVRLMADDPDYLAALNISDAAIPGYMLHMLAHGVDEYERQLQSISGGAPRHVGYGRWFDGNPLYKLGSISTPTRIETVGWTSLIAMWELFAILRSAERPVDLVNFPQGDHVLVGPRERLGSQGGNVDWFRFWLQDVDDPAPQHEARYAYWRELRGKQVAARSARLSKRSLESRTSAR